MYVGFDPADGSPLLAPLESYQIVVDPLTSLRPNHNFPLSMSKQSKPISPVSSPR